MRWRRIDGGAVDEERMKQSVDDHEFVITDVHAEDAGEYECSGENAMIDTVIKQTFTLSVPVSYTHLTLPTSGRV